MVVKVSEGVLNELLGLDTDFSEHSGDYLNVKGDTFTDRQNPDGNPQTNTRFGRTANSMPWWQQYIGAYQRGRRDEISLNEEEEIGVFGDEGLLWKRVEDLLNTMKSLKSRIREDYPYLKEKIINAINNEEI
jgi:hypothetical protein